MEAMELDPGFWKNRRVLLTGHTGFKGAWMAAWLARLGAKVTGFALVPETLSLYEKANIDDLIVSRIGDLRDPDAVEQAVQAVNPEIVLHFGAQAIVRESYVDPVGTFATNLLGTVHLMDALRRASNVKSIVVVTSDKCYENREWIWPYRENEAMGGHDPYSSSKGCAELAVSAYYRSFFREKGIGVATARAGNVIGGGDWSQDRLIADFVRSFEASEPVVIRSPNAVRPWQHVMEALSGYLYLAENLWNNPEHCSQGWNFGPASSENVTVSQIANTMVKLWGEGAAWQAQPDGGPHEAHLLMLDSTKARRELGWLPRLSLDVALEWIIAWHKSEIEQQDMQKMTFSQIDQYIARGELS